MFSDKEIITFQIPIQQHWQIFFFLLSVCIDLSYKSEGP